MHATRRTRSAAPSRRRRSILAAAPAAEDGMFRVPPVIGVEP